MENINSELNTVAQELDELKNLLRIFKIKMNRLNKNYNKKLLTLEKFLRIRVRIILEN